MDPHENSEDLRSFESDMEDFGSTVSLASSYSVSNSFTDASKDKTSGTITISTPRSRLDPSVYRKHRDRNMSLRYNLAEKLLNPVIATSIKKIDKLSQNISNYQVNMQDALFQSRIATSNLCQLQKQLDKFAETNYLEELKVAENHRGDGDASNKVVMIEIDAASEHSNVTSTVPL